MPSAVHNHTRLRAREDGEKPSPPRDCKAEIFGACHCRWLSRKQLRFETRDGKAALMCGVFGWFDDAKQAAKPGNRAESQSWQACIAQSPRSL